MDYEPSGNTPVRCDTDVPSKVTIEVFSVSPNVRCTFHSILETTTKNRKHNEATKIKGPGSRKRIKKPDRKGNPESFSHVLQTSGRGRRKTVVVEEGVMLQLHRKMYVGRRVIGGSGRAGPDATYCTSEMAVLKNNEIRTWDRDRGYGRPDAGLGSEEWFL